MIVRPFDSRDDYIAMIDYYHGLADGQTPTFSQVEETECSRMPRCTHTSPRRI